MKLPTLSFCITCKNRFHQIRQTLRKNLDDNRSMQDSIEFILVDFGSQDGLREWVITHFQNELNSGYLKFFYTEELPYWHFSIAKNTAHLLCRNDILVNLDCDNFTGVHGAQFVINQFMHYPYPMLLHQCSDDGYDGSFGRISIRRSDFVSAGGYDESFEPAGYQDMDLINRLGAMGILRIEEKNSLYNQAIRNSKEECINQVHSHYATWREMDRHNAALSKKNISSGCLVANNGTFGIRHNLFQYTNGNWEKVVFPTLKISFNITCKNRLHHLQQTLLPNIENNLLPQQVEFNLLDYNSTDGLATWIQQEKALWDSGVFHYYYTPQPTCYHRTHSRNMVFRLSTGDLVCNLDADNYLGKGFAAYILNLFTSSNTPCFYTPCYSERDVIGRICVPRSCIEAVRGYNEALPGYGLEDIDLYHRLEEMGVEQKFFIHQDFCQAIHHSHEERVSQEYMGHSLKGIYLSYLTPWQTQVTLLYQDGHYYQDTLTDHPACHYNETSPGLSLNQYFLTERNRIMGEATPRQGVIDDAIRVSLTHAHRIENSELAAEVLVYLSETANFRAIERQAVNALPINPKGWGQGIAYKNFDMNHPIILP